MGWTFPSPLKMDNFQQNNNQGNQYPSNFNPALANQIHLLAQNYNEQHLETNQHPAALYQPQNISQNNSQTGLPAANFYPPPPPYDQNLPPNFYPSNQLVNQPDANIYPQPSPVPQLPDMINPTMAGGNFMLNPVMTNHGEGSSSVPQPNSMAMANAGVVNNLDWWVTPQVPPGVNHMYPQPSPAPLLHDMINPTMAGGNFMLNPVMTNHGEGSSRGAQPKSMAMANAGGVNNHNWWVSTPQIPPGANIMYPQPSPVPHLPDMINPTMAGGAGGNVMMNPPQIPGMINPTMAGGHLMQLDPVMTNYGEGSSTGARPISRAMANAGAVDNRDWWMTLQVPPRVNLIQWVTDYANFRDASITILSGFGDISTIVLSDTIIPSGFPTQISELMTMMSFSGTYLRYPSQPHPFFMFFSGTFGKRNGEVVGGMVHEIVTNKPVILVARLFKNLKSFNQH